MIEMIEKIKPEVHKDILVKLPKLDMFADSGYATKTSKNICTFSPKFVFELMSSKSQQS